MMAPDTAAGPRNLNFIAAISLVVGAMVGIGIFLAPPEVAGHVPTPIAFMSLWLLGGISALCGALAVAELGAMLPAEGGDYPYLQRAYGPGLAFATGWLQLLAVFPGSLAVMAVGSASSLLPVVVGTRDTYTLLWGVGPAELWALLLVVVMTAINHAGVRLSGRVQVMLTLVPVVLLLIGTAALLWRQGFSGGAFRPVVAAAWTPSMAGIAAAFLPVYFAYSGWNAAIFVGGEIEAPERNVPRSLVGGTVLVVLLYLGLCLGFMAVFSMADLAAVGEVGTAAARQIFGITGERVVTTSIMLAMLGSINGTVLTGSRVAYTMGQTGHCFAAAGRPSRRFGTPAVALWLQAIWTAVLVLTHTFEQLLRYASAAMLVSGSLTVVAVMVLRRRLPELPRPYRVWGYPLTPLVYVGSSLAVLAILAVQGDRSVLLGGVWFVGALLLHRFIAPRGDYWTGTT